MEFVIPEPAELHAGLRAIKTLALVDGALHDREREVLAAAQATFGSAHDVDALPPIRPDELAAAITRPEIRRQLLGAALVACMADGEVNGDEAALVGEIARAFQIEDAAVKNLQRIADGHYLRARLDTLRRFWAIKKLKEVAEREGAGVYLKAVLGMLRLRDDPEVTARYRALEGYPAGSLGRGYFDYMIANQFSFPGEKGSPPEIMLFHDLTHVLSGYGTTPEDEILVASFAAGYSTKDIYTWFMFVLPQFQLGIQTAPPNVPTSTMKLDPLRMLTAFRRGAAMNLDLNAGWDYWPVLDQPIEALRARFGILSEAALTPGAPST